MADDHSSRRWFLGVTAATMAGVAGCSGSDSPGSATETRTATTTDAPSGGGSTASPTSGSDGSDPGSTTDTQTPIRRDRDLDVVRRTIVDLINEHREAVQKDLEPLEMDTSLGDRLEQMAQDYSEQLAEAQAVTQDLNGQTVEDRYDANALEGCRVPNADEDRILPWDVLEVRTRVDTYARVEEEIAVAAVDAWKADYEANQSLILANASEVGVGVTLVPFRDEAYIVANFCE